MKYFRKLKIGMRINLIFIIIAILPILFMSLYTYTQFKGNIANINAQYLDLTHELIAESIENELELINNDMLTNMYGGALTEFWAAVASGELSTSQIENYYTSTVLTVFRQGYYINAFTLYLIESDDFFVFNNLYYQNYSRSDFILDREYYEKAEEINGRVYYHLDGNGSIVGTRKIYYFGSDGTTHMGYISVYINEDNILEILDIDFIGNIEILLDDEVIWSCKDEEVVIDNCFYVEESIGDTSFVIRTSMEKVIINEEVMLQSIRLLALAIILFLVSLIANFLLVKSLANPLKILGVAAKKVAKGDFDIHIVDKGNDEITEFVNTFNMMTNQIKTLIYENYEVELQEKEFKLKYLRMQINPHFLYNTLDSMRFKALAHGEQEIGKDIELLSEMFREMVDDKQEVTVKQEISLMQQYIYFQQQIYGDKVLVEYDIAEDVWNEKILKFLLQPLVENSIVHGMDYKKLHLLIRIFIYRYDEDNIKIIVEDDGKGCEVDILNIESKEKSHIGVKNILQRIKEWYGVNGELQVVSRVGVGTKVMIIIPMRRKDEGTIS